MRIIWRWSVFINLPLVLGQPRSVTYRLPHLEIVTTHSVIRYRLHRTSIKAAQLFVYKVRGHFACGGSSPMECDGLEVWSIYPAAMQWGALPGVRTQPEAVVNYEETCRTETSWNPKQSTTKSICGTALRQEASLASTRTRPPRRLATPRRSLRPFQMGPTSA